MSNDHPTPDEQASRHHRRRRLFPLSARALRDERGLVRALSVPGIFAVLAIAAALLFLTASFPTATETVLADGGGCEDADIGSGGVGGDDGRTISAPAGEVGTAVCIKAGNDHSPALSQDGNYDTAFNFIGGATDTCYFTVSGIGTQTVTVTRNGTCGGLGNGISHLDLYHEPPPTPDPDVSIEKTNDTGGSVAAGGTFNWVLTVTVTDGPTTANATVTDTIPAGMTAGTPTSATLNCGASAGNNISCTLPSGTINGNYTVTVPVTAPAASPSGNCHPYDNTANVTGGGGTNDTPSDDDSVTVTDCADPNVGIQKTNNTGGTVAAGGTFNWILTVTVTNGPTSAIATVTDTIPAAFSVGVISADPELDCSGSAGNSIDCDLANGTANGSYGITVPVTAPAATPLSNCTTYENTANVTGGGGTNAPPSDDDSVTVTDCAAPNVGIQKTNNTGGTVAAGGSFNWILTATVTNGPATANATITDTIPAAFTAGAPVSALDCSATVGNSISCILPSGSDNGDYTVTVPVTAPAATPATNCQLYENSASVVGGGGTNNPGSDTDNVTVTDCVQPDVSIQKTNNTGDNVVSPSETFNWVLTVTVTNGPTSAVANVSDTIPAAFSVGVITADAGLDCSGSAGNTVACVLASGTANGSYVITVPVTAPDGDPFDECALYNNTATVSGGGGTNTTPSDSDSVTVAGCTVDTTLVTQVHDPAHADITNGSVSVGTPVHDQATLSDTVDFEAGSINFVLYATLTCTGDVVDEWDVNFAAGPGPIVVETPDVTLDAGSYSYKATYEGDTNHNRTEALCEPFMIDPEDSTLVTEVHDPDHNDITNGTVPAGTSVHDQATLDNTVDFQAGVINFVLYSTLTCTGDVVDSWNVNFAAGPGPIVVETPSFVVTAGEYSYQATFAGDVNHNRVEALCEPFSAFDPEDPDISTAPDNTLINLAAGGSVIDTVTVLDPNTNAAVAGTVDFYVCGPSGTAPGPDCLTGGTAVGAGIALDGNGQASSTAFTPTLVGFYCFRVVFTPDDPALYNAATHTDPPTECFQVVNPDLDIDKAGPATLNLGEGGTYSITVTNVDNGNGGPTVDPIVVSDTLPDGLLNVAVNEQGEWDCAPENIAGPTSADSISCTYTGTGGILAAGDSSFFTIDFEVPDDECPTLVNQVEFSDNDETQGTNITDSVTTDVDGCASDVDITKEDDQTVVVGDTVTFTLTVTNDGTAEALDVVVTDDLPNDLDNVDAEWDPGNNACTVGAGNLVTCDIGTLGVGETVTVTITGDVTDCDDFTNTATVSWLDDATGPDSDTSNTVTVTVNCGSITIVKDTDPETDGIDFTFTGSFGFFVLEDGDTVAFLDLEPGDFTVTESGLPADWDLTAITCDNGVFPGAADVTVNLGTETVVIDLRPGEDVTCLFNNVFDPPVIITEEPTPTPTPVTEIGGVVVTPTPTLVAEIGGVVVTPTPTLISEIQQVRRLPTTGTGGPAGEGGSAPWLLIAVASSVIAVLATVFATRRRQAERR